MSIIKRTDFLAVYSFRDKVLTPFTPIYTVIAIKFDIIRRLASDPKSTKIAAVVKKYEVTAHQVNDVCFRPDHEAFGCAEKRENTFFRSGHAAGYKFSPSRSKQCRRQRRNPLIFLRWKLSLCSRTLWILRPSPNPILELSRCFACEAVPKSKKLLKFTLDDGSGENRTIFKRYSCLL